MNLSDYKRGTGRHSHRFMPVISNAYLLNLLLPNITEREENRLTILYRLEDHRSNEDNA